MAGGGSADLLLIPGGIGLFLLGMSLMTEGLRALAGPALRRILARATRSPLRGAVAGMVATAAMQSSSAVTVMAVGFVGAGLMTFPQAIGVIFGANVGTTSTGWIVALIGFQFDLGRAALALLPLGALARLLGRGAWRDGGTALAGFGLVFMGIAALKAGAAGLTGFLTPDMLPGDGLLGRLALVAIGAGVTVVTQASSAGVAMALTALAAGAISLGQAAALVIGCDIGTTASALLATVGGSTAMRRTGAAHVVYNLMTGALAFLALPAFLALAARLWPQAPEVALVAFHTGFNAAGALLFLPFAGPFGRLIERLFPERAPPLARRLDPALLRDPDAAADAADATVRDLAESFAAHLVRQHGRAMRGHAPKPLPESGPVAVRSALDFAERIRAPARDAPAALRQVAALHALDHLDRLARRLGQTERLDAFTADPALADAAARLAGSAADADWRSADAAQAARFDALRRDFREGRAAFRAETIARAASGEIDADEAGRRLDAMRWLHRVAYHLWRIATHLAGSGGATAPATRAAATLP